MHLVGILKRYSTVCSDINVQDLVAPREGICSWMLFCGRNICYPSKCMLMPNERAEYQKGVQRVRKYSNGFDYTGSLLPRQNV